MAAEEEGIVTALISHGPIGILSLGLAYALRVVWRRNDELTREIARIQEARIAERDTMAKALTESTGAIGDLLESRRR
jgi:hypothetical protein